MGTHERRLGFEYIGTAPRKLAPPRHTGEPIGTRGGEGGSGNDRYLALSLDLCYRVLQHWVPDHDPLTLSSEEYATLYQRMANGTPGSLPGWDYSRYGSSRFFLQLLRRHTFTGAFSHPKYGGNSGGVGWEFLATNLNDPATRKLPELQSVNTPAPYFDWARAHEPPLGRNTEYRG